MSYGDPKPRCCAEIGRPGNFHGCKRLAKYRVYSNYGTCLEYCEAHKSRTEYNGGKYNAVPFQAEVTLIQS
jgi:hypothetical protein